MHMYVFSLSLQGHPACVTASTHFHGCWNSVFQFCCSMNSNLTQCIQFNVLGLYLKVCFIPWLCCLCAEAPRFAWCGKGICLWAILIMSRNCKCLMCSGEVIDIDLCCRGWWRGSIIAGSRQSQLCVIKWGSYLLASVCMFVCEYCGLFHTGPAWKCHT